MNVYFDCETYSDLNLKDTTPKNYINHSSFRLLCIAYATDYDENTHIILEENLEGLTKLSEIFKSSSNIIIHNSMFDFVVWNDYVVNRYGLEPIDINKVVDTFCLAKYLRIPASLDEAVKFLKLDTFKDESGKKTLQKINRFLKKRTEPTKDIYDNLYSYCIQDVVVLKSLYKRIQASVPENEKKVITATLKINLRGVPIDSDLVHIWIEAIEKSKILVNERVKELSGGQVSKVSEVSKIKKFLGWDGTLTKDDIPDMLVKYENNPKALEILKLRMSYGSASINRITKLINRVYNGRVYGAFIYHKANTGRWSSVGVQFQNLPRGEKLEEFLSLSLEGNIDALASDFELPNKVKMSFRSIIKSNDNLVAIDYSSIEYVVMAWLSKNKQAIKDYENDIDVYKIMASRIYKKPIDKINSLERNVGKTAMLSLQYQVGVNTFASMLLSRFKDIKSLINTSVLDFAENVVNIYKYYNKDVVYFWEVINELVRDSYINGVKRIYSINLQDTILIEYKKNIKSLLILLPSNRYLIYRNFRIDDNKLVYTDYTTISKGVDKYLYGGKLANHITQGIARDIIAHILVNHSNENIVSIVHDEIIFEGDNIKHYESIMKELPKWFSPKLKVSYKSSKRYL